MTGPPGVRAASSQLEPVSSWQELASWNAVWSSPLASSWVRLVYADVTWVCIVARAVPTVVTAAAMSLTPEMSSTADSIVSVSVLRSLESWSSESFAC